MIKVLIKHFLQNRLQRDKLFPGQMFDKKKFLSDLLLKQNKCFNVKIFISIAKRKIKTFLSTVSLLFVCQFFASSAAVAVVPEEKWGEEPCFLANTRQKVSRKESQKE